jgi:FMN phosphatase YigB (HAD superfamily)
MAMSQNSRRLVFLIDVDNTLLNNDRVAADLKRHLSREVGEACQERYWALLEQLRYELGYADYLGALQQYRVERPHEPHLLEVSSYLINYPFANRLYPGSLDAIEYLSGYGTTVILSDGDVVFQPLKIERSGLFEAVEGRVLVYIHKERELREVERLFPADHYAMIDDKIRILTTAKEFWGTRLTTVFVRQGHYADSPETQNYPDPDISIDRIGDLAGYDIEALRTCDGGKIHE